MEIAVSLQPRQNSCVIYQDLYVINCLFISLLEPLTHIDQDIGIN